VAQLIEVIR